jgi:hypothetical protein
MAKPRLWMRGASLQHFSELSCRSAIIHSYLELFSWHFWVVPGSLGQDPLPTWITVHDQINISLLIHTFRRRIITVLVRKRRADEVGWTRLDFWSDVSVTILYFSLRHNCINKVYESHWVYSACSLPTKRARTLRRQRWQTLETGYTLQSRVEVKNTPLPLRPGVRDQVVMWDFVVDKVAPEQVSSEYFSFPCRIHSTSCSKKSSSSSSINQSSGICTIGQMGKRLWPQYKGLIDT